jgi:thiamine-monophosphate kinase
MDFLINLLFRQTTFSECNLLCTINPNLLSKTRSNKKISRLGCTDSSDGLFQAVQDLAVASKCKAIINYEKLPKDRDWPKGNKWDEYYLFGGEDYELVFALPKKWAKSLSKLDKNIKEIGYFAKGEPLIEFKESNNNKLLKNKPFKHF